MPPNDPTDVLMRLVRAETRIDSIERDKRSEHDDIWSSIREDREETREAMKELAGKVDGLEKARDTLIGLKIALYGVGVILLALAGLVVNMQMILANITQGR